MIAMRHTGIYVNDIARLEMFYTSVFRMITICSQQYDSGELFDELLGIKNSSIMTTKLVTPYGKKNGQGDMLELVKVITDPFNTPTLPGHHPIYMTGMGHIAFGIADMDDIVSHIVSEEGYQKTNIVKMKNGNLCCFCTDPEGNWIELIQRKEDNKMGKMDGRTVLVTGGSSGIGGGV